MRLRAAAILALTLAMPAAGASTASADIGPLTLKGNGTTLQTEPGSVKSFAFSVGAPASTKGYGGLRYAPATAPALTVTKSVDKTSPKLVLAAANGTHFATVSLLWTSGAEQNSLCLQDALISSVKLGGLGGDGNPVETVVLNFAKYSVSLDGGGACGALGDPPPFTVVLQADNAGHLLNARVSCLSDSCRGTLSLRLPSKLCASAAAARLPSASQGCARAGVRLGRISLGNGSVKVLRARLPRRLGTALGRLTGGARSSIIAALTTAGRSIRVSSILNVGRPRLPSGLPAVQSDPATAPTTTPTTLPAPAAPAPAPQPPVLATQALAITSCSGPPPVGTPMTAVTVSGTLTPPRSGVSVKLTYTPVLGPLPFPATVTATVTTLATGVFTAVFDRQGYGWSLVASVAADAAYQAPPSASCEVPLP